MYYKEEDLTWYYSPQWCSLCHKDAESIHHIFLHCAFSSNVWNHFTSRMGYYWVMPKNLKQMFSSWRSLGAFINSAQFGDYLLHSILWNLWRERNNIIFFGTNRSNEKVIEAIIRELGSWLMISRDFKDLLLSYFIRDWASPISYLSSPYTNPKVLAWKVPPQGVIKLNFDGASKGNPSLVGFGCVICDHNGNICKVCCGPLEECNSTKSETMGMLMGLRELSKMRVTGAIIESDSAVVIGWGQGKECQSWKLWSLVYEVIEISSEISCSFSLIPREQNSLAGSLTNWGVSQPSLYYGSSIPF